MDPISPDVVLKAFRKIIAAVQGMGHQPVVTGELAAQAWGAKGEPQSIEVLIKTGEAERGAILGAARGEGMKQLDANPSGTIKLTYTDPKSGGTVAVNLVEASTPQHQRILGRAQDGVVQNMQLKLAPCEELILGWAATNRPMVVSLLRATAGRMDAQYLKREAEAAGVFDAVKSAWAEAKQQA